VTRSPKVRRLNRIFRENGRTLIVAMDHAGVFGNIAGLERPGETIRQVRDGGADAVLTTYGVCKRYSEDLADLGLILRVDGAITSFSWGRSHWRLVHDAKDALRLGADAVCCMGMPGSLFEDRSLHYLPKLVSECAEWNLPVLAEMLPGAFENPAELWTSENIGTASRIGAELGADFIKTTYSGDLEGFRSAVDQVNVPVVVLGGGTTDNPRELLSSIRNAMDAGASGAAVGRNIFQYPEPQKITTAIAAIVHDDATVDEAIDELS